MPGHSSTSKAIVLGFSSMLEKYMPPPGTGVLSFGLVAIPANSHRDQSELELAIGLIDKLTSEEFHPENYQDEYRIRVLANAG